MHRYVNTADPTTDSILSLWPWRPRMRCLNQCDVVVVVAIVRIIGLLDRTRQRQILFVPWPSNAARVVRSQLLMEFQQQAMVESVMRGGVSQNISKALLPTMEERQKYANQGSGMVFNFFILSDTSVGSVSFESSTFGIIY